MMQRTLAAVALLLLAAIAIACGGTGATRAGTTPTSSTVDSAAGAGLYIALGDSLSFGIGASDANTTSFVSLVHASLGARYELLNLGVPGATSQDLIDGGNLDRAVQDIAQRKGDSDPANDVRLVTLEVGGNDLLHLYGAFVQTAICPSAQTALAKPECSGALRSALDGFRPNAVTALDRLRSADASLRILLLTLYNPFDYLPGVGDLGDMSLEGKPDTPFAGGLNDIIREVAQGRDNVTVVDTFPLFKGRTPELIASDGIHPNDAGHRVMADAVTAALVPARAR